MDLFSFYWDFFQLLTVNFKIFFIRIYKLKKINIYNEENQEFKEEYYFRVFYGELL